MCRKHSRRALDLCSVCHGLLRQHEHPCFGCGLPLPLGEHVGAFCGSCLAGTRAVSRSVMGFAWQDPVRNLISQFKYQNKLHYGKVLSSLLAEQIRVAYGDNPLPDLLVPVPLHNHKLLRRGYNQSLLVARQLSHELGIQVNATLVQRTRNTRPQQGLGAAQRRLNLRGAFKVNADIAQLHPAVQRIALIDDVVTTMTTANTLAKALRKHLPADTQLHLWALARA